ncbi:MAG: cation transporter [Deltaproteobacteria bacterium]|nr:cation transporter [Deltaproteobacteria bacterium]
MVNSTASKEKQRVALISLMAAIFLTLTKLIVGILTNSLGILSEALHSGLDLVAALMTFFAVRVADIPADSDHHFGHAKIENLSALFETLLLLITCVWIAYEAISRLTGREHQVEVNIFSFAVIIVSIVVDYHRSRALSKMAAKHNSQALEADALHFSSDIWSSAVVLLGLIVTAFGYMKADAVAALLVAAIVVIISLRLGKRSYDVLIDRAPLIPDNLFNEIISSTEGVRAIHDVRTRSAGAYTFMELNLHVDPMMPIFQAHELAHSVQAKIQSKIKHCFVHVHTEPHLE